MQTGYKKYALDGTDEHITYQVNDDTLFKKSATVSSGSELTLGSAADNGLAGEQFTMSAWLKRATTDASVVCILANGWSVDGSGKVSLPNYSLSNTLEPNQWYHICWVQDSHGASFYINGQSADIQTTLTNQQTTPQEPQTLGFMADSGQCLLSHVHCYQQALSPEQVQQDFELNNQTIEQAFIDQSPLQMSIVNKLGDKWEGFPDNKLLIVDETTEGSTEQTLRITNRSDETIIIGPNDLENEASSNNFTFKVTFRNGVFKSPDKYPLVSEFEDEDGHLSQKWRISPEPIQNDSGEGDGSWSIYLLAGEKIALENKDYLEFKLSYSSADPSLGARGSMYKLQYQGLECSEGFEIEGESSVQLELVNLTSNSEYLNTLLEQGETIDRTLFSALNKLSEEKRSVPPTAIDNLIEYGDALNQKVENIAERTDSRLETLEALYPLQASYDAPFGLVSNNDSELVIDLYNRSEKEILFTDKTRVKILLPLISTSGLELADSDANSGVPAGMEANTEDIVETNETVEYEGTGILEKLNASGGSAIFEWKLNEGENYELTPGEHLSFTIEHITPSESLGDCFIDIDISSLPNQQDVTLSLSVEKTSRDLARRAGNGDLGIGTDTPTAALDVHGDLKSDRVISSVISAAMSTKDCIKLKASDCGVDDNFGYSVDVDGEWAIVGAYGEDSVAKDSGAAYLYKREVDDEKVVWSQKGRLKATSPKEGAYFGISVAICGEWALVGARHEGTAGAAYLYRFNGEEWGLEKRLEPNDQSEIQFGTSVAISENKAVVGARWADGESGSIDKCGSVYIYELKTNGTWVEDGVIQASDKAPYDYFGQSVSIDGDWIVVGAHGKDKGESSNFGGAYIFKWVEGNAAAWQEIAILQSESGIEGGKFGVSVSICGSWIAVGAVGESNEEGLSEAGAVHLYNRDTGVWLQSDTIYAKGGKNRDLFGNSVSIYGDQLIVGAYGQDTGKTNAGAAYLFHRNTDDWIERNRVQADKVVGSDFFGFAVGISEKYAIVGARGNDDSTEESGARKNSGASYMFDLTSESRDLIFLNSETKRVGIGTDNPKSVFHVNGTTTAGMIIDKDDSNYYLNPNHISKLNEVYAKTLYDFDDSKYFCEPGNASKLKSVHSKNGFFDLDHPKYGAVPASTSTLNKLEVNSLTVGQKGTPFRGQIMGWVSGGGNIHGTNGRNSNDHFTVNHIDTGVYEIVLHHATAAKPVCIASICDSQQDNTISILPTRHDSLYKKLRVAIHDQDGNDENASFSFVAYLM